jgi:trigger factor
MRSKSVKSTVEKLSPTRVRINVEVPFTELQPDIDTAFKQMAKQVRMPGFRPGKVPVKLLEARVDKQEMFNQVIGEAVPARYSEAVTTSDVRPLGQPEITDLTVPLADGDDLTFTAEVDTRPEIDLPDFSDIELTVDEAKVEDETVEQRLTDLRARFGTLKGVDRAVQDGDFVSIDLSAEIDGEQIDSVTGVSYEVGSKNMLEGLDEALIGMTADETKNFTAPLAGGDQEGQDASCTVTVTAVKERELPELDDEFAQLASEFDTLDELKADLTAKAEVDAKFAQGVAARDQLLEAILEKVEVPIPESIVEAEVHSHLEGEGRLEDDEHRAEVGESTRKGLKTQLVLDAIAEKEEVKVEQQELIEFLVMSSQQYGMDPNQFAQSLDQEGQIPAMVAEVARRKALATVLEKVAVKDTAGNVIDLNEAVPGTEGDEAESADETADEVADDTQAEKADA